MTQPVPPACIEFSGSVECRKGSGALLSLIGRQGGVATHAHLAVSAADALAGLPALMQDVRLVELAGESGGLRTFELQAQGLRRVLQARSLQVHRDAAREFFAAVPPVPVPPLQRTGWALLLALLRIPGFVGLLKRLRGTT